MEDRRRILAIDATRGAAMVLVCLSHANQYLTSAAPWFHDALTTLTRTATPTFLLFSGFIAGHLLASESSRRLSLTLIDRGLFLLLIAHLLLAWSDLRNVTLFEWLFVRAGMTDAVAVALCIAPLLRFASTGFLLTLGTTVFCLSWVIALTASFESAWANQLGAVLFNMRSAANPLTDVALLPYFAVFVLGMALSRLMRPLLLQRDDRATAHRLMAIGVCAIGVALAGALGWRFFHELLPTVWSEGHLADLVRSTIDPRRKWPPSPAYALFYGGAGLLMAAVFFLGRPAFILRPIQQRVAVLGQASLMCFVVQDWLLFLTPRVFGFAELESTVFWLAYFAAVVTALYLLSAAWVRHRGNRFLTVGLRALARRSEARATNQRSAAPAFHSVRRGKQNSATR